MPGFRLKTTVVIDAGSGSCRAGFAGEEVPRFVFPTMVGRPRTSNVMAGTNAQKFYVGEEAQQRRGICKVSYPIVNGIVADWDDMEKIWGCLFFNHLRVNPQEHVVLLTEPAMNPKANRMEMTRVMFTVFHAPAMYVATQAVLSLYASGRTTGVVGDIGDGVSHVVPIYEGFAMPHAVARSNLSGKKITEYLMKLMSETGVTFSSSSEKDIVRDIKEKCCYVAKDFFEETETAASDPSSCQMIYEMPDGQKITLGSERFRATEALFKPVHLALETPGFPVMLFEVIMKCEIDIRKDLFGNVVLSGGSSMFRGFGERVQKELSELAPGNVRTRVLYPDDRAMSVFIGGSMIADLDSFMDMCVSRDEFVEHGPSIIHRKCF
eukprot:TRINITY_DN12785_c0_g1_i2.p1 TRINITY_DN12785_c0_g1~~TRINITY_DN12785_c0_g1_i2.p1  ORF type:complete len:379 (-),score=65.13 TRINITY_DN12785_c0_g1_i2:214-1350(-)